MTRETLSVTTIMSASSFRHNLIVLMVLVTSLVFAGPRTICHSPASQLWKTSEAVITGTVRDGYICEVDYSDDYGVAEYRFYNLRVAVQAVHRSFPAGAVGEYQHPVVGEDINVLTWVAVTMLSEVSRDFRGSDFLPSTTVPSVFFLHYESEPAEFMGTRASSSWRSLNRTSRKSFAVNYPSGVQNTSYLEVNPMNMSQLCHSTAPCELQDVTTMRECKGSSAAFMTPNYREANLANMRDYPERPWENPVVNFANDPPSRWTHKLNRRMELAAEITSVWNSYNSSYNPDTARRAWCNHRTAFYNHAMPRTVPLSGYVLPLSMCNKAIPTELAGRGYANQTTKDAPYLWRLADAVEEGIVMYGVFTYEADRGGYYLSTSLAIAQSLRIAMWYRLLSQRSGSGPSLAARNFLYFTVPAQEGFDPRPVMSAAGQTLMQHRDLVTCNQSASRLCSSQQAPLVSDVECNPGRLEEYFHQCARQVGGCFATAEALLLEETSKRQTFPRCGTSRQFRIQLNSAIAAAGAFEVISINATAMPVIPVFDRNATTMPWFNETVLSGVSPTRIISLMIVLLLTLV